MSQPSVPTNVLIQFTMSGQLLNGQGPNAYQPVYWDVYNTPDYTGQYSGYYGQLQNIVVANVTQISSASSEVVIPTGPASGDLAGNYPGPTLAAIQGNLLGTVGTLGPAQNGFVLSYNAVTGLINFAPTISDQGPAGGDLDGYYPNPGVIALRGNPLLQQTLTGLQDGYCLTWEGSYWYAAPIPSGFTPGGDLGGTVASQIVKGLYQHPLAATVPAQSYVPVWDIGPGNYSIRQLTADDIGAGFTITGFSGGSTVDIGATVTNPAFTASYSHLPTSAQITNTDSIDSPLTLTTPFTSGTVVGSFRHTGQATVTFDLTAVYTSTQNAYQYINYYPRMFAGVGAPSATGTVSATGTTGSPTATLSTGDVLASQGLTSSPVGTTYGPFSPAGQKIYLLLTGSGHVLKDPNTNTIIPTTNTGTSVSFANLFSATVGMYLYETLNTLTGSFSVLVSS